MLTNGGGRPTTRPPRARSDALTHLLPKTTAGTLIMPRIPCEPAPAESPPSGTDERGSRVPLWRQFLLFILPAALTFAVGRWGIAARQLWNDEHITWHAARLDWNHLLRLLDHVDLVLAPYYVLMHGWVSVAGDTPTMLRVPSLVAMALATGFTALVGQRLFDAPAGLIAGVILAVIPSISRYGQEARPYAFAVAGAMLATLLLLVALDRPRWPWWLLYSASVALTAYFHLVTALVLVPHLLLAWLRYQRSERDVRFWKFPGALAAIAALVMPLAYAASSQSAAIDWIKADWDAVIELPMLLFGSYSVAAAVAGMGLLAAVVLPFVRRRGAMVALLAWVLVPPLVTYLTSPWLHLFLFRYLLFTLPGWALLAAGGCYGITRLVFRRGWPQLLVAAAALPALILLVLPAQQEMRQPVLDAEPDFQSAAATIKANFRPGDAIAFVGRSRPPRRGMEYELRDGPRPADIFLARSSAELGDYWTQECGVTPPCLGDRQRIWLVSTSYSEEPWLEMQPERAATLKRAFLVAQDTQFQRIHVYLLVRTPARR